MSDLYHDYFLTQLCLRLQLRLILQHRSVLSLMKELGEAQITDLWIGNIQLHCLEAVVHVSARTQTIGVWVVVLFVCLNTFFPIISFQL